MEEIAQNTSTGASKFDKFFSSTKEKFVCALGNNFVENFLATGGLSQGFAVLSDKRVYFKGTVLNRVTRGNKSHFIKTREEKIVDVKDVTGTGFIYEKNVSGLVLAIIASLMGLLSIPMIIFGIADYAPELTLFGFAVLIAPVAAWIAYFKNRRSLFEIVFAGGAIAFNTVWLNQQEIQDFQRNIRLMKDAIEDRQAATPQPVVIAAESTSTSASTAEDLAKYKALFDSGAISEDEFNDIKAKLIGKL